MRFAHLGDCHLGGWRQPELQVLNFESFAEACRRCVQKKVDFVLIAGDLFDSAYPPIETLKNSFSEFRKLKEANIPVFLIAGSHDYSVSGKTFLDVLERAGFCTNVGRFEEQDDRIVLFPTLHNNVALYGFPGKKSGLEVDEVERIKLHESPGLFSILMLHTTIRDAIGNVPVKAVDEQGLPRVDYLALAHLHIVYAKENRVYSGPCFPNNFSELEELRGGSFYVFDNGKVTREEIKLREVVPFHLEITNALTATEEILSYLLSQDLNGKVVLVRLSGVIEKGKIGDVDLARIEDAVRERGAYAFLKSTSKVHLTEPEVTLVSQETDNLETEVMSAFQEKNPSKFNSLIPDLLRIASVEKLEDETNNTFEERLLAETKRVIEL